jgi:hypothetical protein
MFSQSGAARWISTGLAVDIASAAWIGLALEWLPGPSRDTYLIGLAAMLAGIAMMLAGISVERRAGTEPHRESSGRRIPWVLIVMGLGVGAVAVRIVRRASRRIRDRFPRELAIAQLGVSGFREFAIASQEAEAREHPAGIQVWKGVILLAIGTGLGAVFESLVGFPPAEVPWAPLLWLTAGVVALAFGALVEELRDLLPSKNAAQSSAGWISLGWGTVAGAFVGSQFALWIVALRTASVGAAYSPILSFAPVALGLTLLLVPWTILFVLSVAPTGPRVARTSTLSVSG